MSIQSFHRSTLGRCIRIFLPVAIIVVGGAFALFHSETTRGLTKIRSSEQASVRVGTNAIKELLHLVNRDLAFLTEQASFIEVVSEGTNLARQQLVEDWKLFSRTRGVFDQIRWLDQNGQEQVRVNFNNGNPVSVARENLQNKSGRYYFADAVKLNRKEIFISPFDLNVEKGKIEKPLKPMIRVATPVYNRAGDKQGIVLLNYFGEKIIDKFEHVMRDTGTRPWLLNRDGYWLKGPSVELEWGFMYQDQKASLPGHYPEAWKKIIAVDQGQFEDRNGLWTFATIFPILEGHKIITGTQENIASSRLMQSDREYFWKIVLLLPNDQFNLDRWNTGAQLIGATMAILLAFFVGAWRLVDAWTREDELRQREERFRSITNTSSVAIIITIDHLGNVVTWNPAAENAFGYFEKEILGKSLTVCIPERYIEAHNSGLKRATETEEYKIIGGNVELFGLKKSGDEFPIELSLGTWRQDNERYFSAVMHDITERKKIEDSLKYEINIKNRFFSIIAHDLKSPFTSLLGMTHTMSQMADSYSKDKLVHFATDVNEAGKSVFELLQNLLEWSRLQMEGGEFKPQIISLHDLTQGSVSVLNSTASEKEITITNTISKDTVFADPDMVQAVIRNLISNSIKFTPFGGEIELSSCKKNGFVQVTVSDTGIGIPSGQEENIFALDQKTSTIGTAGETGTGLGLPLCKEMIEKNGGTIWSECTSGEGSHFHFTLPVEPE
ncbi:MAG: PAS domain S-box protein [Rhodospirillaceae bacterium]|jgi:PAS domain S-box-containing protein|nr:PAS domain S-box protein [Rhodospirillaceae bacterium]MBT4463636.1 PAS domain S-box protein [Rhodospirillaceae bacterium]MBT5013613.1 PAS domain S-box protein [Rhodospirillaceae bacterium]MBT5309588.1 PAS domain S-box protein [Rhodospirillaceae bacterium]MBT7354926.1 PAS domain S-box protein [Rhodospirillaceae bacterium]